MEDQQKKLVTINDSICEKVAVLEKEIVQLKIIGKWNYVNGRGNFSEYCKQFGFGFFCGIKWWWEYIGVFLEYFD